MPQLPDLPQIATVELLLIQVGVDAIISREVEKIGKGKLREMAAIPGEIRSLARKLVRGDLEPSLSLSDFEWRAAVRDLSAGWDQDQVVEMCQQFPPELQAAASALIIKSVALIKELSEGLPLTRYQTLAGSKSLVPADTHTLRFACVLEVIRNPLIIFQLAAGGALLKIQAHAVRETYPTLSSAIDAAITGQIMVEKAEKKSFELDERAERGVKTWMGQGPIPDGALKQSQTNVAALNAKKQAATPPPKKPTGLLTAAQRSEAKASPTP